MQQLWVRWPLQPLQALQKTQLQPPFGPSVDSLCHECVATTHLSFSYLSNFCRRHVRYYWYIYMHAYVYDFIGPNCILYVSTGYIHTLLVTYMLNILQSPCLLAVTRGSLVYPFWTCLGFWMLSKCSGNVSWYHLASIRECSQTRTLGVMNWCQHTPRY